MNQCTVEDNSVKAPQSNIEISAGVICSSRDTIIINAKADAENCSAVPVLDEEARIAERFSTIPHDTIPSNENAIQPEWRGAQ